MTVRDLRQSRVAWNDDKTFWEVRNRIDGDERDPEYQGVVLDRVYFLLDPDACQIKIGYTRHLKRRIAAHRSVRPNLEVLGTMRGGRRLEATLHGRFEKHRREGEWFSSEIYKEVMELLAYPDEAPKEIAA